MRLLDNTNKRWYHQYHHLTDLCFTNQGVFKNVANLAGKYLESLL